MAVIHLLAAAFCAFAVVLLFYLPTGSSVGLVVERLWRAVVRAVSGGIESLSRTSLVARLLERDDWAAAAREVSTRLRPSGPHDRLLDLPSACAGLCAAGLAVSLLAGLALWSPVALVTTLVLERLGLGLWRRSRERILAREASEEMPGTLRTLSVALGSGHTLAQAIEYVGEHGDGPVARGFSAAALRIKCGMPTEDSLGVLARELSAPGLEMLVTTLVISHRTGSPLRELLMRSAALVERQEEFRRSLSAKTAQVRLSAKIVCALPLLMLAVLSLISPDFQRGLLTPTGLGSVIAAALIDAAAVLVIRKMMKGVL